MNQLSLTTAAAAATLTTTRKAHDKREAKILGERKTIRRAKKSYLFNNGYSFFNLRKQDFKVKQIMHPTPSSKERLMNK